MMITHLYRWRLDGPDLLCFLLDYRKQSWLNRWILRLTFRATDDTTYTVHFDVLQWHGFKRVWLCLLMAALPLQLLMKGARPKATAVRRAAVRCEVSTYNYAPTELRTCSSYNIDSKDSRYVASIGIHQRGCMGYLLLSRHFHHISRIKVSHFACIRGILATQQRTTVPRCQTRIDSQIQKPLLHHFRQR